MFLLRVLAALVKECKTPRPRALRAYLAHFHPMRERGELIVINHQGRGRRSLTRKCERIALVTLCVVGLILPTRAQQASGPSGDGAAAASQPSAAQPDAKEQEILQELDAMKKRIEELEAELKATRENGAQPAARAAASATTAGATTAPAPASPAAASPSTPGADRVGEEPTGEERKDRSVFRLGLDVAERQSAQQRYSLRYAIFHAGNSGGYHLQLRFQ
jgi:hypothetical protein